MTMAEHGGVLQSLAPPVTVVSQLVFKDEIKIGCLSATSLTLIIFGAQTALIRSFLEN